MELQVFTSRNGTELDPDIMIGLTKFERKLAKHFDRVEIRGKRSRMVPVLLTPDMIAAMELLAKARSECQVRTENVYLFARPGVLSHYRGSDCFRKYANKCGAKYPRLRKQVATLSTVLNLKENEMDQLATFLGTRHPCPSRILPASRAREYPAACKSQQTVDCNGERKTV